LRREDVVGEDYGFRVTIRDSKSQPRTVLVVEHAHLLKLHLQSTRPGERVFRYTKRTAEELVSNLARKAGIPKRVTPHLLRHLRATHMLAEGMLSETEAMLWFGWKTRSMLDRYVHLTMRHAHEKVLSHLRGGAEERRPVTCWRCHHVNRPRSQRCVRCGVPLGEKARKMAEERYGGEASLEARLEKLEKIVLQLIKKIERREKRRRKRR